MPAISRRASPLFGALSVHEVREGERRDERQACEREADKDPTCLREAAPAKAGNAAGGLFQQAPCQTGMLRDEHRIGWRVRHPERGPLPYPQA
ncbi:MAG: hypothetical protein V3U07_04500, partial [Nitrospirales bacterium]